MFINLPERNRVKIYDKSDFDKNSIDIKRRITAKENKSIINHTQGGVV